MQQIAMKTLVFVVLLGVFLHDAAAVTHSLKYFYTSSSEVPNFPEFVSVGLVDEVQMVHYDSNTQKAVPKQDWMNKAADAQYWERNTGNFMNAQQSFKANIDILKPRFNQTGGVHIFQLMYGCEWDDETQNMHGFYQFGYDGEDFIALDLKTGTWTAPNQQALITKNKWDHNTAFTGYWMNYLTQTCIDWLKKYVDYGRSSLMRTELPSVSLLQQTPSSPVRCLASGFYPERASLTWRKDGDDLHEDVEHGEILPNNDGTFQTSADLKVSLDKPEDWKKYNCVFQLSGVKDDIVTKLDKTVIKTNWEPPSDMTAIIAAVVVVALVLVAVGIFVGYKCYNRKPESKSSTKPSVVTVQAQQPLMNKGQQDSSSSSSSGSQDGQDGSK